ncbi:MAG: glycosyltransferase 87 family protein [Terracidiphilus sp.]|nr:glycosyltransferase 87 family protein [Terracidiphilus sp.]
MGFPGIYQGTQCLLHGCDPYNPHQLESFYAASGSLPTSESPERLQAVTLYVNLPTTFLFVAPFTLLPLQSAQAIWNGLLILAFLSAAFLVWQLSAEYARRAALFLACVLLSNCIIVFSGGNTAGLVVALSVIAAWCIIQARAEWLGVLCLAAALTVKPHDSGMVWLYFLLVGGIPRKRALQSAALAAVLSIVAVCWVSVAAPHWMSEMRTNLAAISSPGGINEPGPTSIGVNSADMIIDLQTVFSIVWNQPQFYNALTFIVCGAIFVLWVRAVLRARFAPQNAWFALVSGTMLSMLVTYHRSYDAKLLLLAIPACSMLSSRSGVVARTAYMLTAAAFLITADIPLTAITLGASHLPMSSSIWSDKLVSIVLGRPVPLILLAVTVFYLWVFIRETKRNKSISPVNSAQFPG